MTDHEPTDPLDLRAELSIVRAALSEVGTGAAGERSDTRERLLARAVERFARYGFYGTSIRHLTSDVSITAAGFYSHFASKEDLVTVALARGYVDFLDAVLPEDHGDDEHAPPRERLRGLCVRHAAYTTTHGDPSRLANDILRNDRDDLIRPDTGTMVRRAQHLYFSYVLELVCAGRGRTPATDPDGPMLAEAILALCEAQVTSPRPDNAFRNASPDDLILLIERVADITK